jgi:deazaflavin-dependent oxidoreductase (nitroreductase family)
MIVAKSSLPKNKGSADSTPISKSHRVPFYVPLLNPLMKSFLHIGVPAGPMTLLTVRGRKTGRPHTTPVGLFALEGRRYIFDTFGNADWVRNLRAIGEAVIGRGWSRKHVTAWELNTDEAALVLRDVFAPYVASRIRSPFLRMGYSLTRDSTTDDYAREARRHPGFELHDKE